MAEPPADDSAYMSLVSHSKSLNQVGLSDVIDTVLDIDNELEVCAWSVRLQANFEMVEARINPSCGCEPKLSMRVIAWMNHTCPET